MSRSAVSLAESVNAKAVVAFTASGNTAYRMSRERSNLLLVVMTPDINVKESCHCYGELALFLVKFKVMKLQYKRQEKL